MSKPLDDIVKDWNDIINQLQRGGRASKDKVFSWLFDRQALMFEAILFIAEKIEKNVGSNKRP